MLTRFPPASFPHSRLLLHISRKHRRLSPFVLSDPTATAASRQVQLDLASVGDLRLRDWEDFGRALDSANHRAQHRLEETDPLRRNGLGVPDQCRGLYNHIRAVRSPESVVGFGHVIALLGPQNPERLRHFSVKSVCPTSLSFCTPASDSVLTPSRLECLH